MLDPAMEMEAATRAPTPRLAAPARPPPIRSNQPIKHILEKLFPANVQKCQEKRRDVMKNIEVVGTPKPRIFFLFRSRSNQVQGQFQGL